MKIYNVKIKTMADDRVIENGWVQIENGKFAAVCEGRPQETDGETAEALKECSDHCFTPP